MIAVLGFLACGGKTADVLDGTYTINTEMMEDSNSEETLTSLEGLTLVVNGISFTLNLGEDEILSGELTLREEADWGYGCPTNAGSTSLMTYDLGSGFEVAGITYETPVVASGCSEGATVYISESGEEEGEYGCFSGVCLPMVP